MFYGMFTVRKNLCVYFNYTYNLSVYFSEYNNINTICIGCFFLSLFRNTSITAGLIFFNIVAQRINYINLQVIANCCTFMILK